MCIDVRIRLKYLIIRWSAIRIENVDVNNSRETGVFYTTNYKQIVLMTMIKLSFVTSIRFSTHLPLSVKISKDFRIIKL